MIQKTVLKTKNFVKVKFSFQGENAETVKIFGLNGDWDNAVEMSRKKDGTFSAEVQLPKNTEQEFKYFVNDSEWVNDPEADGERMNDFGSNNSVLIL